MKKLFKKIIMLVVGVPALLMVSVMCFYPYILFPASRDEGPVEVDGAQIITLQNDFGDRVEMFYSPILGEDAKTKAKTIIYFHGNNETLKDIQYLAEKYNSYGFNFAMAEYPGYGDSMGEPSEESLYSSGFAVINYLIENDTPDDQIVLVGYSLGTGVATQMAYKGFGTRLVLIAPYTSVPDVASGLLPFLPMDYLISDHFDTLSKAPDVTIPTLIIHGDSDKVIPYEMGERLSHVFPDAEMISYSGKGHLDYFDDGVLMTIAEFLRE